jgi:hypothetical protein
MFYLLLLYITYVNIWREYLFMYICHSEGSVLLCWVYVPMNDLWNLRFSRGWPRRMPFSEMWRCVAFVRSNVSKERVAANIRVTRIGEPGTMLRVTSNWSTLQNVFQLPVTANVVLISRILVFLMMEVTSLRDIGCYKSHTARHPRRRHSLWLLGNLHPFFPL